MKREKPYWMKNTTIKDKRIVMVDDRAATYYYRLSKFKKNSQLCMCFSNYSCFSKSNRRSIEERGCKSRCSYY